MFGSVAGRHRSRKAPAGGTDRFAGAASAEASPRLPTGGTGRVSPGGRSCRLQPRMSRPRPRGRAATVTGRARRVGPASGGASPRVEASTSNLSHRCRRTRAPSRRPPRRHGACRRGRGAGSTGRHDLRTGEDRGHRAERRPNLPRVDGASWGRSISLRRRRGGARVAGWGWPAGPAGGSAAVSCPAARSVAAAGGPRRHEWAT